MLLIIILRVSDVLRNSVAFNADWVKFTETMTKYPNKNKANITHTLIGNKHFKHKLIFKSYIFLFIKMISLNNGVVWSMIFIDS